MARPVGQSLKTRGRRWGQFVGGLGSGAGGSAGPSRTEQPRHRPRPAAASGRLLRRPGERAPSLSRCGHSSGPGAGNPRTRNPQSRAQPLPASRTTMTHFNKGPSYGLSAEVKNKVRRVSGGGVAAVDEGWEAGRRPRGPWDWGGAGPRASPLHALPVWLCREETSGRRESGRASRSRPGTRSAGVPALSRLCPRRWLGLVEGGEFPGSWNPAAPACSSRSQTVAAARAPPGRGRSCLVIRP